MAAPGWNHSSGSDTSVVYYGSPHIGTTQWYRLLDSTNGGQFPFTPHEGNYSFSFSSGDFDALSDPAVYEHAFISQVGTMPADTRSIQFWAQGDFEIFFSGRQILMEEGPSGLWAGDLTPYQGLTGELQITESGPEFSNGVVVLDAFRFSTMAIPEPSVFSLLLPLSCAALFASRDRRRR